MIMGKTSDPQVKAGVVDKDQNIRMIFKEIGFTEADILPYRIEVGKDFKGGTIKDARTRGAKQAFTKNADGKGYIQELALPWKLLAKDGLTPKPGETISITVEPNFTIGQSGRLTLKDLFKPGVTPDRVFTFMSSNCWGLTSARRRARRSSAPPTWISPARTSTRR